MKSLVASIAATLFFSAILHGEDVSLTAENPGTSTSSQTITLNQGDTARLLYFHTSADSASLACVINAQPYSINLNRTEIPQRQITISGPATIQLTLGGPARALASFQITRAGLSSPPASIPQEAGTTWEVILESSSDLNGTGLSTFSITSAVVDFDESGSVFGEELIGFRSSLDGSGLAAEGADVDAFGGANADDL